LTLAHTSDGGLPSSDDDLDPLRALCALAWTLADSAEADDAGDWRISGSDEVAAAALRALGLSA
jgi:hypothetical protein